MKKNRRLYKSLSALLILSSVAFTAVAQDAPEQAATTEAETKAAELEANDRIKLLSVGVTNSYNKETKKKTADQFVCYDFEFDSEKKKAETSSDDFMDMPDDMPVPFAD